MGLRLAVMRPHLETIELVHITMLKLLENTKSCSIFKKEGSIYKKIAPTPRYFHFYQKI
jgi:hypothetical protein